VPKTIDEVYDAVLDVKGDVLNTKKDVFALHQKIDSLDLRVNHEQEAFTKLLAKKIDRDNLPVELFKSLGFKLMNRRLIRWGIGVIAAWALGTLVFIQGGSMIDHILRAVLHALENL